MIKIIKNILSSTSTLHLLTIALSREDEDIMLGAGVDWLLLSPAFFKNSWLKLETMSKNLRQGQTQQ